MCESTNIIHAFQKRALIRIAIAVIIMAMVSIPGLMTIGYAEANSAGTSVSCGHNSKCKSIEGKSFELIAYSSLGSEMVILYSKSEVGEITIKGSETNYSKTEGTVLDAIYYLSRHSDYDGFTIRNARKSTGLFRSEVIANVYIVLPNYTGTGEIDTPRYSFKEKDGKIRVRITPVAEMSGD